MHFVNNYAIIVQISLCIITYILNGGYNLFISLYHPQLFIADDICSILMCIGLTGQITRLLRHTHGDIVLN